MTCRKRVDAWGLLYLWEVTTPGGAAYRYAAHFTPWQMKDRRYVAHRIIEVRRVMRGLRDTPATPSIAAPHTRLESRFQLGRSS